ncbi:methyltransferase domain-containing protein [Hyphomicrobium sp. xq]|uniref:Methyltransferase domain-containing protein n=1 Tax=Hyphomicrobium album TaxID=2665159 RepID=A0A6I3KL46_9HYPH|nr:class I SAM-dependent methyltransferase [Hyphomicrobium album]MTD94660.1 methyltransferase domain-containing protein [Hyphomicrobium album]
MLRHLVRQSSLGKFLARLKQKLMSAGVSTDYATLAPGELDDESARLRDAWKNEDIPQSQRQLVDRQLDAFRRGSRIDVFDVLIAALRSLPEMSSTSTVLEIGCSSGYYSEVLQIAGIPLEYSGCDYSPAFVDLAKRRYPDLNFNVEDSTMLSYPEEAFDVVVSGCCLLHIPEFGKAVEETGRVARRFAIFHRTPVVLGQPTTWYRKKAYGVETIEIHFNEDEFTALLEKSGLPIIGTHVLSNEVQGGVTSAVKTYVCEKRAR